TFCCNFSMDGGLMPLLPLDIDHRTLSMAW
ncbi:unnamed protein product, partial [marine sediment metagenome]